MINTEDYNQMPNGMAKKTRLSFTEDEPYTIENY